jgi:hypothetical protein
VQEVEAVVAPWSQRERTTLARELRGASQARERRAAEGALRKHSGLSELADRYLKPKDANSFWALVTVILMVLSLTGVGTSSEQKTKIIEKEKIIKLENPPQQAEEAKPKKKRPPPPPRKSTRSSKSKKRGGRAGRRNKKESRRKH